MRPACARCSALRNMLIVRRNRNIIVVSSALFYDDASLLSQLRADMCSLHTCQRTETEPKYSYRYFWRTFSSFRRFEMWKKQQTKMVGCGWAHAHTRRMAVVLVMWWHNIIEAEKVHKIKRQNGSHPRRTTVNEHTHTHTPNHSDVAQNEVSNKEIIWIKTLHIHLLSDSGCASGSGSLASVCVCVAVCTHRLSAAMYLP